MGTTSSSAVVDQQTTWRGEQSLSSDEKTSLDGAVRRRHRCRTSLAAPLPIDLIGEVPANQPPVLLVSHIMPVADGNSEQRRAWRWLEALSASHEIWLAIFTPEPVHFAQWRAAENRVARWMLRPSMDRKAKSTLQAWFGDHQAQVLLHTCTSCQKLSESIPATHRLCDLAVAPLPAKRRWWPGRPRQEAIPTMGVIVRSWDNDGEDKLSREFLAVPCHHEAACLRHLTASGNPIQRVSAEAMAPSRSAA